MDVCIMYLCVCMSVYVWVFVYMGVCLYECLCAGICVYVCIRVSGSGPALLLKEPESNLHVLWENC